MNVYIYALVDPVTAEARYVGKAMDLAVRMKAHRFSYRSPARKHYPVNRWIAKHARNGLFPSYLVLEICDETNWVEAEMRWIAFYRANSENLLNVTAGGEGVSYVSTPERNKKISDSLKGKTLSLESRAKISRALTGRKYPPNPKKSAALKGHKRLLGRTLSEEHRRQVLAAISTPEVAAKRAATLKERNSKTWIVTTPSGEEIEVVGLVEYSKANGLDPGTMNRVGRGVQGRTQHRGYKVRLKT